MVDPHKLSGRQDVCRLTALFAAVLAAGIVSAADSGWVRPTGYQQTVSGTGNVPLVRIDTVPGNTSDSQVAPVSYVSPTDTSRGSSASSQGLRWIPANAEATSGLDSGTKAPSDIQKAPLVTPIPSVMPRYSKIHLTAGEEGLDLDSLDGLSSVPDVGAEDTAETLALPAVSGGADTMGDGLLPEVTPDESFSAPQIPGAIGNDEESTVKQGGLIPSTDASAEMNTDEPQMLPAQPQPLELPAKEPTTETFSTRQVDDSDFDMPCESSEPMHRITEITNDIELHDDRIIPRSCPLSPVGESFPVREFPGTNFTWTASNLCHNPLYFEQPGLERHGHTIGPLQPVLSGAQFLATIPALPMLMAIDPPNECQYSLGYYRPGSCAPRKWSPIPYSTRGAIATGGVATALVFLIP